MKYDLQILVPIIPDRLEVFKKIGIYNVGVKKILIYCLVGTNKKEIYQNNWPDNVDVEIIESETNDPTAQIYKFLSRFTNEQAGLSSWFSKIDDDTFNDISNLIDHLNKFYNPESDFYLVTEVRGEMARKEIDALKKLDLFSSIDNNFSHELEGCWLSKSAINKIVQNKDCKNLFELRGREEGGYTDQTLGAAAKLCKIYPIRERRFTVEPTQFINCSIFEGDIFHFHPISKTKSEKNWKIINYYYGWENRDNL
jgi:hypothetical protein